MIRWRELALCFGLLSRLPVPQPGAAVDFARAVWGYPVVGACLGGIAAGLFWGGLLLGLPSGLVACWVLAAGVLLTGGLHEDGLADTADGFGGGRDRARKLEIMRDSRIGSFGALALLLGLAIRGVAIAALPGPSGLVVAGCLARAAIVGVLLLARPARADGMAAGLAAVPWPAAAAALGVAALVSLALLPVLHAVLALAGAGAVAGSMAWLARRQVGGHTGDVLGATAVLAECVVLTLLCLR